MSLPECQYDYRYQNSKAKVFCLCNNCDREIYIGDNYYDMQEKNICKDCIIECERIGGENE